MTVKEVLQQCVVDGNNVKLPNIQLERNIYLEVAKSLSLIGGKWKGGKISAFVFQENPKELLEEIASGEKRNLKKEYQFFATPDGLADYLVSYANLNETHSILEPSAGQGAIVKAINKVVPESIVNCFELMPINQKILNKIPCVWFLGDDFMQPHYKKFDRIIANPPFSKNQDIDHVYNMYNKLNKGGRLVSITSKHWEFAKGKKENEFREWLQTVNANYKEIPRESFKSSGTMVGGIIIIIDKH